MITKHVQFVGKKKFTATVLDSESETFVVYVTLFSSDMLPRSTLFELNIHLSCKPQVSGLIAEKALTKVSAKYSDFADVFSPDLAFELLKYTRINNHAIKLVNSQQLLYEPIYSLGPVELKALKAYIKTNLANGFIRLSKFSASILILFDRKSNGSFRLSVNY